jgi:NADPH:quinone reductase-like Zn-dependent oxidoreductase
MGLIADLGADHVVDYTRDNFAGNTYRYDAILDIGGNSRLSRLRRALAPSGRLVIIGGGTGGRRVGGFDRQIRATLLSPLVKQKFGMLAASENPADLTILPELLESHTIAPAIDRTFLLAEVPAAISYVAGGEARGKNVIAL